MVAARGRLPEEGWLGRAARVGRQRRLPVVGCQRRLAEEAASGRLGQGRLALINDGSRLSGLS